MSFYNPDIKSTFDADKQQFIVCNDNLVASYCILFHVKNEYNILSISDITDNFQLDFVNFCSLNQQLNFSLISPTFHLFIAKLAIDVYLRKICSFESYLQTLVDPTEKNNPLKILYLGECIQDFIEYLIFSDIAFNNLSDGNIDFTKLMGKISYSSDNYPVFYSLYDRLKLYNLLKTKLILDVNQNSISFFGSELCLTLTIRI